MAIARGDRQVLNPKSKMTEDTVRLAYKICAIYGANDETLSEILGIDKSTLNNWKKQYPEFYHALALGKVQACANVAESFYNNCMDRWIEEEKEHVIRGELKVVKVKRFIQGDKWAQIKYLAIRSPETWADTTKMEITRNNNNTNLNVDLGNLSFDELMMLRNIQQNQLPEDIGNNE
jgi:hypothetical protein